MYLFSYDGKRDVLKEISFEVKNGQTIAFVGHTGSGKSSIINLFMRFYEFDRGRILIDGQDIKDYSQEALRKSIGLVLQEPFSSIMEPLLLISGCTMKN